MAQRNVVKLIDDLDGTPAAESVEFGLDGATYVIDLSKANAARLRAALEEYVPHSRRIGGRRKRKPVKASNGAVPKAEVGLIREWAAGEGIELNPRGRIPGHVREAYQNRNKTKRKPRTRKG